MFRSAIATEDLSAQLIAKLHLNEHTDLQKLVKVIVNSIFRCFTIKNTDT